MKLAKTLIAASALVLTAGANADWFNGSDGTDGELILNVWNPDTNQSFTQDLGVLTSGFLAGTEGAQSFSLDAAINQIGNSPNIRFNIAGFDGFYDNDDGSSIGFYLSGNTMGTNFANTYAQFVNQASSLDDLAVGLNGATVSGDPNHSAYFLQGAVEYTGSTGYWGTNMGALEGYFNFGDSTGGVGEQLGAYAYTRGGTIGSAGVGDGAIYRSTIAGVDAFWSLDLAGGTLEYTAVPVPAAVWLFGSALLGLAGAIRRKKMQA